MKCPVGNRHWWLSCLLSVFKYARIQNSKQTFMVLGLSLVIKKKVSFVEFLFKSLKIEYLYVVNMASPDNQSILLSESASETLTYTRITCVSF